MNTKYHDGEFSDPALYDPYVEHKVTWATVDLTADDAIKQTYEIDATKSRSKISAPNEAGDKLVKKPEAKAPAADDDDDEKAPAKKPEADAKKDAKKPAEKADVEAKAPAEKPDAETKAPADLPPAVKKPSGEPKKKAML